MPMVWPKNKTVKADWHKKISNRTKESLRNKKKQIYKNIRKQLATVSSYLSIITLKIKILKSQLKHQIAEWTKQQDPTIGFLPETHISLKHKDWD